MKLFLRLALFAFSLLLFSVSARTAYASNVDLQIGWHWADGEFWDPCDVNSQSCLRFMYVDVHNNSTTINTYAHLHVGNADPVHPCNTIPTITHAFKATTGWGVVSPNGTLGFLPETYTDYSGNTWNTSKRIEMLTIAAQETRRYILAFEVLEDTEAIECMMGLEVTPKGTDNDPSKSNNSMGVNVGACLQSPCDFSAFPF